MVTKRICQGAFLAALALTPLANSAKAQSLNLLEGQDTQIWAGQNAGQIIETIAKFPDNPGSRAMAQLIKAALLAPVPAQDGHIITAARLKKLLAMGGINEAKTLADQIETDDPIDPVLMDQILLTFIASGARQAACIDLLAYNSEAPEQFAQLSEQAQKLHGQCLPSAAPASTKASPLNLKDLSNKDPWDYALVLDAQKTDQLAIEDPALLTALSPYQQSALFHIGALSPDDARLYLPMALRRDFITLAQASEIYVEGQSDDLPAGGPQIRTLSLGKAPPVRLGLYAKALAKHKDKQAELTNALTTPLLAASSVSDFYALLPFIEYIEAHIDIHNLRPRAAFLLGLLKMLDGKPITTGAPDDILPPDAPWPLTVLNDEHGFSTEGFTIWSDKNYRVLSGMAPDLVWRLTHLLQDKVVGDKTISTYFTNYVNNKHLTPSANYVMHKELDASEAESWAAERALGAKLATIAHAADATSPDQLDPAGAGKIIRMLNDMGFAQSARKLSAEYLVFQMRLETPMGNNK